MKITKKAIALILATVCTFALVGCGSSEGDDTTQTEDTTQNETQVDDTNKEDEGTDTTEVTPSSEELPIVTIEIENFGTIKAELYPNKAPNTVNNFISLIESGYYEGLTFHRIIEGFMNQGGCPEGTGMGNPGYSIPGEFSGNGFEQNDIIHEAGILSMARSGDPDSAGSQFFIMAEAAPHLDGQYAAFGKVIEGMDVVTAMNQVETGANDAPVETVKIKSISVDTKGIEYGEVEKVQ